MIVEQKLKDIQVRAAEIEAQMNSGTVSGDELTKLSKEYSRLNEILPLITEYFQTVAGVRDAQEMLNDPELREIARRYKKSVAQIILRWHIQRGVAAIPGTPEVKFMEENLDVFDFRLTESDMERIKNLDMERSLFYSHTDPVTVEFFAKKAKE